MIDRVKIGLHRLFEEYKVVRRVIIIWIVYLITRITYIVFSDMEAVTGAVASAYASLVGLLAVVIGFYQWSRERDR